MNSIKDYRPKIVYLKHDIIGCVNQKNNDPNSSSVIIVPHVCNNVGLFGAGFAKYIGDHFPIVKENFYMLGSKAHLGYTQYINVKTNTVSKSKIIIANMISQNGIISNKNVRPINYAALVYCMQDIKSHISSIKKQYDDTVNFEIHAPKFGSGLAGGNWLFIEKLIEDIWTNIPVYIYVK